MKQTVRRSRSIDMMPDIPDNGESIAKEHGQRNNGNGVIHLCMTPISIYVAREWGLYKG